jgi:RNA polymerase sigma-70 factor (ECF subfamily)
LSRRITYLDEFNGKADENLRAVFDNDSGNEKITRIKATLLKVIKNELTERQREIIMLYYYKGLNTVEIADILGITPQAASAVLRRARKRIFRCMQYII